MKYRSKETRLKEQASQYWGLMYNASPCLSERYPDAIKVDVYIEMEFISAVAHSKEERHIEIRPSDKLYLHLNCANNDCTGSGFDLTSLVRKSLVERSEISGLLQCDGKEDWKYYGHNGCSCQTTLDYRILPLFFSAAVSDEP